MKKRRRARELTLRFLYNWDFQGGSINDLSEDFWKMNHTLEEIREFCERLVKGTSSNLTAIDSLIGKYANRWEIDRISPIDKSIMRFAIFELLFADDIPCTVTIDEAVAIAKRYGNEESGSFINGVLDKIKKEMNCEAKKIENRLSGEKSAGGKV